MKVTVEFSGRTCLPIETRHENWGDFYIFRVEDKGYVWVSLRAEAHGYEVRVEDRAPTVPKRIFVEDIEITERKQIIQIPPRPRFPRPPPPIPFTGVTFASTWNVQCGIATYTKYLVDALHSIRPDLRLDAALFPKKLNPVLHVEHEFGYFPDTCFVKNEAARKVVTWHCVLEGLNQYYSEVDTEVDAHVTHLPTMQSFLQRYMTKPVQLIPHGSLIFDVVNNEEARARLNLPQDKKIAFLFGFRGAGKGYLETLRAIKEVLKSYPNFHLIISAAPHQSGGWWDYVTECIKETETLGIKDNVTFLNKYLNDTEINLYCCAADLLIFNYMGSGAGSTSGALHRVLGAGKPIVASNHALLQELTHNRSALIHDRRNPMLIVKNIIKILEDQSLAKKLGQGARNLAEETSWHNAALKHLDVYKMVCES